MIKTDQHSISRRAFLRQAAAGAIGAAYGGLGAAPAETGQTTIAGGSALTRRPPNILFIITDDQNYSTLACYGAKTLSPNMDSIAREGVRFDRFYTTTSVCCPSRYACLTGQYASRSHGNQFMRQNPPGEQSFVSLNVDLPADSANLGRVLHEAGYTTGAVGKWHLGFSGKTRAFNHYPREAHIEDPAVQQIMAENHALMVEDVKARGFDFADAIYWDNIGSEVTPVIGYNIPNMEWITRAGLEFIEQNKDRPFYLYYATPLLHNPISGKYGTPQLLGSERVTTAGLLPEPITGIMPPRETINQRLSDAGIPEHTPKEFPAVPWTVATEHILWLDDAIGALLRKIGELGLAEDTIVILFSENSTISKFTCYELGVRVPAMMRWKGHIPAGQQRGEMLANIDFAPTILDIAGVTPPAAMKVDGKSFWPLVQKGPAGSEPIRDTLFTEFGFTRAVTTERWKYLAIRYPANPSAAIPGKDGVNAVPGHGFPQVYKMEKAMHPAFEDPDQLYDLENDPHETKNLAADPRYAPILADMKQRLAQWLATFERPFGEFLSGTKPAIR